MPTIAKPVPDTSASQKTNRRIPLLDIARGVALVAMAIYHFAWDLEFFGWMAPATTLSGGWLYFARGIASSFLFLVGISLVLAHQGGIRWPAFWKRFAQVAGAAATISVVTWFAVPGGFIFFGILHAIALFSLIGLIFVRSHWIIPLGAALAVLLVWQGFNHELFSTPALWWVGLAPVPPQANDYVPTFPWLAAVLTGISCARLFQRHGLLDKLATIGLARPLELPLTFIGRHSLVFYLVHQPILLALVWTFTTYIAAPDRTAQFLTQCQQTCTQSRSEDFCRNYCPCIVDEMKQVQLFTPFLRRNMSEAQNVLLLEKRDLCVARQN